MPTGVEEARSGRRPEVMSKPTEGDPLEQPGYAVKKYVWCGDAGRILRDDMVRMLGPARFYFVEWPEGIKDANDMLLKDGLEPLGELVREGHGPSTTSTASASSHEPAPMTLWKPGFD